MNKFIFDVDGTLTPSRKSIDVPFQRFFLDFIYANSVCLVTGSDSSKTIEQLGQDIFNKVDRVYNCNGNDVWESGVNTYTNEWILPIEARHWLEQVLDDSDFSIRTGNHIEERPGMVNFSIVGRNADSIDRGKYVRYEGDVGERGHIAQSFNNFFPNLQATVGGETGIDIAPRGSDKSQIIKDFDRFDHTYFFGDMMLPGGNDYPLAVKVTEPIHVTDWKETKIRLEKFQELGIAL